MLKDFCCRAACGLALVSAALASSIVSGQDGAKTTSGKSPVAARSIRPFVRSETPANQAPNLYDKSSDEFNYFREDLGRQELSSRQKARIEQLSRREVYADPMDKPAADGTPFIDIYSPDEVYEDGEAFVGYDDPDVMYAADENNLLAKFANACESGAQYVSLIFNVGASSADTMDQSGSSGFVGSMGPAMSMPTPPPMVSNMGLGGGPSDMGAMSDPKDAGSSKAAEKKTEPSKADDSQLIFQSAVDDANPFEGKLEIAEGGFDFFKADREFVVKETAPQGSGFMGSMSGNASDGINMGTPPEMMGGISRSPEPSSYDK
ncbi:MAG: hypothetical protein IJM54_11140 [Thermoguttaceae bacterium]|nr:hypothetical protein [Thermoguttaceae bacterium]